MTTGFREDTQEAPRRLSAEELREIAAEAPMRPFERPNVVLALMAVLFVAVNAFLYQIEWTTPEPEPIPIQLRRESSPGVPSVVEPAKRSEAAAPPFSYDKAVLAEVEDYALDVVEEPAFYHLLARVHGLSPEELATAAETEGSFTWEQLGTAEGRSKARGTFATLQGRFATPLFQRVLERYPNEAGLAWVWQGIFRVENRGYFVTLTDKAFEPRSGPEGEVVELTGAFLKGYAFTPVNAELGVKRLPHVVAKGLRRVPAPEGWNYMMDDVLWFVVSGVLLGVLLLAGYAWQDRSSRRRGKAAKVAPHARGSAPS